MWKSVPIRDEHFRHTSRRAQQSKQLTTSAEVTLENSAPVVTVQDRNTLANRLKKIAHDLTSEGWVQAMLARVALQLQHIVSRNENELKSVKPHIVGLALGIGTLSDPQSLVQLACFLSLFHSLAKEGPLLHCTWELRYFDPVVSPLDAAVCERLSLLVEKENHFCAYRSCRSSAAAEEQTEPLCSGAHAITCDAIIAFMPHCGLPLYSNMLLANCDAVQLCDRLILLGNDLSTYRDRTCTRKFDFFHRLYPSLAIERLYEATAKKNRQKCESRISGVGFAEVDDAFSDLSFIVVQKYADEDESSKAQLLTELKKRSPKLFLSGDEQ